MSPDSVLSALNAYIAALCASAHRTRQAEDRSRYRDHLATAARLFHLLYSGDVVAARGLVRTEQKSYGTDFLSGHEGAAAEAAFQTFAALAATL